MAAVKYEFSIGVLKAFYSIFCPDILLVYISRNAVSENKKKSAPKVSSKCPFNGSLQMVVKEFIDFMFHVCIIELRTSIVELFSAQRSSKNDVIHKLVYNLLSK